MTACLVALGILLACPEPPDAWPSADQAAGTTAMAMAAPRHDVWLAEDKLQHFAMSFGVTAFSYAAARTALDPDAARLSAGIAALAAGVGKEIYDARQGEHFSVRDLVWDVAGIALGLAFVHQIR